MSDNDLKAPLDLKGCQALNEDDAHPLAHALDNDSGTFLASDADAQLVVTLALQGVSRVARVQLRTFADARAPKTVKLFANRATLDFADAEASPPTQTFVLLPADTPDSAVPPVPSDKSAVHHVRYAPVASAGPVALVEAELPLHLVLWRTVTHVSLFVEDNASGDDDAVSAIVSLAALTAERSAATVEFLNAATFDAALAGAGDKPVFVDFTASWCGPCKKIAPVFQALAEQNAAAAKFFKLDVDASKDLAQRYSVTAMPTFVAIRNGKEVDRLKGADEAGLKAFVAKNIAQ